MQHDDLELLTWWQRLWRRRLVRVAGLVAALCLLSGVLLWSNLRPPKTIMIRGWDTADANLPSPPAAAPALAPWFERDEELFPDLPLPSPGDWLWQHEERGQSFKRFVYEEHARPSPARDKLYILPIGDISPKDMQLIRQVATGCEAFFQMPVTILDTWQPRPGEITSRQTRDSTQWLIKDILDELPSRRPDDAYALLGVTMMDIWPGEGWNYVFGQATWVERVGVQSFARYDPAFGTRSGAVFDDRDELILRRGLKVMTHEFGHMFGVRHCTAYACVMNGANSLEESERHPPHLCPVCLQKMQYSVGFDPAKRYRALESFYTDAQLEDLASWIRRRQRHVTDR